jgi:hypothetical protein
MYEDNTMNMMGLQNNREEALRRAQISIDWLESDWFKQPLYVKYGNRPLLFCFGPQYFFRGSDWSDFFSVLEHRPYFIDLDNRTTFADASFPWPPMHLNGQEEPGIVTVRQLTNFLDAFNRSRQRNRTYRITSVFPAFQSSTRHLPYNDGAIMQLTWDMAFERWDPHVIQLVTWNDFQEGTCFEPTIERGYNELEFIQDRVRQWYPDFPFTKEDLRWPLEFYKLRYTLTATVEQETAIKAATAALIARDAELFRLKAAETGATIDINDLKPLLRN